MGLVLLYSVLLIGGMATSQFFNLDAIRPFLMTVTMSCLAYIMVEVGLEFTVDKKRLGSYGWDYVVAMTAAAFPWIFCAIYFMAFFQTPWKEAFLVGRFAAPTSAGVLFAMLAAAGLGTTWLFRKVRILAVFDDLDTILLLIPLQIMYVGMKSELFLVIFIILAFLWAAYYWLHRLRWPTGKKWLLGYSVLIVIFCQWIERSVHVHLEVLLPAFALGCILYNPHDPKDAEQHSHEHTHIEPEAGWALIMDRGIKAAFMFLVGCSLPKIALGGVTISLAVWHVVLLTLLSNLGKCFPTLCYRKEASLKERFAVSVAMFPRGEVGAAVLFVALGYGIDGLPVTFAGLSLALNLLLTGAFLGVVIALISPAKKQ
jgi:Kef-type K+ transport system membrane component KefB